MPSTDQDKPQGNTGQRNRKAERRRQKTEQPQSPTPDRPQAAHPSDANEQIEATPMSTDAAATGEVMPADRPSINAVVVVTAAPLPVNLQTIANVYGDYTRKSLDETRSFLEQLASARSVDKVIEIQSEFARHACETFFADSQKIWELYSELARQFFRPLQGLLVKATQTAR